MVRADLGNLVLIPARALEIQSEPVSRPWGLREFEVLDPEGKRLTFGEPFE